MPIKTVGRFEVKYLQILDEKGICDEKLMPKLTQKQIKEMYRWMILVRNFDEKILNLQRQGRVGTHAPIKGQEACEVGSSYALEKSDWLFPTYRDAGAQVVHGGSMVGILQYLAGDEFGQKVPDHVNNFPMAIPIGTQTLHAVGVGMAANIKKEKIAAIVYFGDGATSTGDVHEAMNFAGVFQSPVVFLCQNNGFAISLPRKKQTHSETIAQKAIGYGFEGIQVDGNDIFAVYKATKEALDKAKNGGGPTLIECLTYRRGDHTTSDDSTKYRDEKELIEWIKKDPIDRLKKYMTAKKMWTEKDEQQLLKEINQTIESAVVEFEKIPRPLPENIFKYTYKEMPESIKEQWQELKEFLESQESQKQETQGEHR